MKRVKPKVGDVIHVKFYDHADMTLGDMVTGDTALVFEMFGRVVKETPSDYRVAYWMSPENPFDDNNEYISVVKGAIISLKVLK